MRPRGDGDGNDGEGACAMMIKQLRLDGFLSFAPGSEAFELRPLNVLIGPNGSGKSNVIEALGLLADASRDLRRAVSVGGGPVEWLWKGHPPVAEARIEAVLDRSSTANRRERRYRLIVGPVRARLELLGEAVEKAGADHREEVYWYYQLEGCRPTIYGRTGDAERYREVTGVDEAFSDIRIFNEWTPGRHTPRPDARPESLPEDRMFPDGQESALVLNRMAHGGRTRLNDLLKRFFPRFERLSIRDSKGTEQLHLHESGFEAPIPATRLSDGTLRFVTLLATLLSPSPPPLLCIEAPERGLHPDAAALLAEVLVEASRRMQLVVTTHSDALVSALSDQPDTVVACERPGAATELSRLDPAKLASWLADYCLGDLWRMGALGANP